MDAWLTRMYERDGRRYLLRGFTLCVGLVVFALGPVGLAGGARYEGLDADEYLISLVACWMATGAALLAVLIILRPHARALLAWASGERGTDQAAAAREAAFVAPRRVMLPAATGCAMLFVTPVAVASVLLQSGHSELLDWVELSFAGVLMMVLVSVFLYGYLELALRPLRATLSGAGPVPAPSTSLPLNLLIGLLALAYPISTIAVTLDITREAHGAGATLARASIALAATLIFAAIVAPLLAGSVLGPIRQLIRGTRAVAAGRLDEPVPVTTTDEFAELALSFNEMLAGLRERESLREQNVELVDELRASRARIVAASDESRRRIERDLHDGAQQRLVLLKLNLGLLERKLGDDPEAHQLADELRGNLDDALAELRDLAHGIYPQILTSDGLSGALAKATEAAAIPTQLSTDGAGRYPPDIEAAIYFCSLEALQNAAKYAGPGATARITLVDDGDKLTFEIADDGPGFDTAASRGGAGLQNMSDRIGALGGELQVESRPGNGTTVAGSVPILSVP